MKIWRALALTFALGGCAAQTSVERIGVGYNNAVANLTDQLALLNVVRAQNGYPLHYTSLSRLSGSITFKMTGSLGGQIKDSSPVDTTSGVTTTAPTGVTVANTLTHAVTSGGNQYTPGLGGEVDTNPSFDVDVNDTQDFYRGITGSIDPGLVDDLIRQGYDQRELLALIVANINFTLKDKSPYLTEEKGASLLYLSNQRGDLDVLPAGRITPDKDQFSALFGCYVFQTTDSKDDPKVLAPLSRVGGSNSGAPSKLTLQDLAILDGTKLDLSGPLTSDPVKDSSVNVVRPASKKSVGKFSWDEHGPPTTCPLHLKQVADHGKSLNVYRTDGVPPDRVFVGGGLLLTAASLPVGTAEITYVPVDIQMTIRSPEAVIQFIGACLGPFSPSGVSSCKVGGMTLFELRKGRGPSADVSAEFGGARYFIDASTGEGRATLRTIGLIEKLIDLNKSAADKPVTTPVHVVS